MVIDNSVDLNSTNAAAGGNQHLFEPTDTSMLGDAQVGSIQPADKLTILRNIKLLEEIKK